MVLPDETLKQLVQGVWGVTEECGGPEELLPQHPTGLAVDGAPQIVAQLERVLDAHLADSVKRGLGVERMQRASFKSLLPLNSDLCHSHRPMPINQLSCRLTRCLSRPTLCAQPFSVFVRVPAVRTLMTVLR